MHHAVDPARAAQHLAARPRVYRIIGARLRDRLEGPVDGTAGECEPGRGIGHRGVRLRRARFQQQHAHAGLRKPCAENATRRTATDNDVVEGFQHGSLFVVHR